MAGEPIHLRLGAVDAAAVLAARGAALRHPAGTTIVFEVATLGTLDALGAARLLRLVADARAAGLAVRLAGANAELRAVLEHVPPSVVETTPRMGTTNPLMAIGAAALRGSDAVGRIAALVVDTARGLAPFGRRGIKWDLVLQRMAQVGARATPIVVFISFLVGVVLALNGALQLRQFGAQIFIANLVGISMTREMGPLITAIVVAGRSGSAIAAELGTMVVSEEVDALRTMALDPARFLVVPTLVAMVLTLPLLTVLATASGIVGGYAIGVLNLGLPSDAYLTQSVKSLFVSDVMTGLVKSVAFAILIALVGAYRGLSVRGGPEGVGRATTAAVVTAIILCIATNAGFTTLFYYVE